MAYNTNQERLVVKGSERITHDLKVNGGIETETLVVNEISVNSIAINSQFSELNVENFIVDNITINGNITLNNNAGTEGEVLTIKGGIPQWQPTGNVGSFNDLGVKNLTVSLKTVLNDGTANNFNVSNMVADNLSINNISVHGHNGSDGQILGKSYGSLSWITLPDFYNSLDVKNLSANNAITDNLTVNNATLNNLSVSNILTDSGTGDNGQVLGKVNGKIDWVSPASFDTNHFTVNYLTVNNNAEINGSKFTHQGFDVTSVSVISEDDYNNLPNISKTILYVTKPNGNFYLRGFGYTPTTIPPQLYSVFVNLTEMNQGLVRHSLLLNTRGVINNLGNNSSIYALYDLEDNIWVNSASVSINTQDNVISNAITLFVHDASNMYSNCSLLQDSFIINSQLISNAPSLYNPLSYCVNMSNTFNGCSNFNKSLNIPSSVTNVSHLLQNCSNWASSIYFINDENITDTSSLLGNTLSTTPKYLYCNNSAKFLGVNSNDSIIGDTIEWTQDGNNYSNTTYNIFIISNAIGSYNLEIYENGFFNNVNNQRSLMIFDDNVKNLSGSFYQAMTFNNVVILGNSVVDTSNMFNCCFAFNQPINIPDSVVNMSNMFHQCYNFNQPISIGNNVKNMEYAFYGSNFNQPITLPNNITSLVAAFSDSDFNQLVEIPNSVTSMFGTFKNCYNFNQPVTIPNSVENLSYTFSGSNFNQPVTIPDSVTSLYSTFSECHNFNQPVTIPDSVTSLVSTFAWCPNFNQPVIIPDSVKYTTRLFAHCNNFNSPVTIGNNVNNMAEMFRGTKFNQIIEIPNSVKYLTETFAFCNKFNQPITIPNSVVEMQAAFQGCTKLNQPIVIPYGVRNIRQSFIDCFILNQPITIPNTVTNMQGLVLRCNTLQNSTVPIHISSSIALGSSNYIYKMLVNGGVGITIDPSRILNDA